MKKEFTSLRSREYKSTKKSISLNELKLKKRTQRPLTELMNPKSKGVIGFTLIELLVVISIIGLLSSVVFSGIKIAKERARITKVMQFSATVKHSLGAYIAGEWVFEDNFNDISGYGNNGVNHGVTFENSVSSELGKAAIFVSSQNDYIDLGTISTSNLLQLHGNLTIAVWINPILEGDDYQRIVDKSTGGGGSNGYGLWIRNNGIIGFSYSNDGWNGPYYQTDQGVVVANTWQHFVVTGDGTDYKIYKDGNLISGSYNNGGYEIPALTETNMRIGNWPNGLDRRFNGLMDNLRIYNRALSLAEIKKVYAGELKKIIITKNLFNK